MKVAIVGDTHFGLRGGQQKFHDHFEKFYSEFFFPYIHKNKIDTVIQLGDLWDQRKHIPVHSVHEARRYFFEPLAHANIQFYTLVGNHDIPLRKTTEINSSKFLLEGYDNIHVIDKPQEVLIGEQTFLALPWICDDNREEVLQQINRTAAPFCLGHLELRDFEAFRGHMMVEGDPKEMFQKFDLVLTGHYHHRSRRDNIQYVGTPYEMTWSDFQDPKGFHIFDTQTGELDFIESPFVLHSKITYTDDLKIDRMNIEQYKNTFVRVIVQSKENHIKFDSFIDALHNVGCYDIKLIEELQISETESQTTSFPETSIEMVERWVDEQVEIANVSKEDVKNYLKSLFLESQMAEE